MAFSDAGRSRVIVAIGPARSKRTRCSGIGDPPAFSRSVASRGLLILAPWWDEMSGVLGPPVPPGRRAFLLPPSDADFVAADKGPLQLRRRSSRRSPR